MVGFENTSDVAGGKPIAVWPQSITRVRAVLLKPPFTTSMEENAIVFYLENATLYAILLKNITSFKEYHRSFFR
jgi:hypothetical protein